MHYIPEVLDWPKSAFGFLRKTLANPIVRLLYPRPEGRDTFSLL